MGDSWDERERSRDTGLRRIQSAFDSFKWFVAGAFAGMAGMFILSM